MDVSVAWQKYKSRHLPCLLYYTSSRNQCYVFGLGIVRYLNKYNDTVIANHIVHD